MLANQVIRPKGIGGWFNWVHIASDDEALCGRELTAQYRHESREGMEGTICRFCLQSEVGYSVKTLQQGQVRRYGPSHYIYEVTDLREEKRGRDEVLADCRRIVKAAYLKSDPNDSPDDSAWPHFRPTVHQFSEIGDGVWKYFVFKASTH